MLADFSFSAPLMDEIKHYLEVQASALEHSQPEGVGTAFGVAPASTGCASDADKAKEHVRKAITDMAAGLLQYRTSIDDMHRSAQDVEDVTEVKLKKGLDAALACTEPTFAAPSQCTVPGNSSENG